MPSTDAPKDKCLAIDLNDGSTSLSEKCSTVELRDLKLADKFGRNGHIIYLRGKGNPLHSTQLTSKEGLI